MLYFTSDLHFNHNREFLFRPRGFDNVEDMNDAIVERWNSIVTSNDTVYVLGDLCLGGGSLEMVARNKELIESLNGQLIIIRGNHDTAARIDMYNSCKNVKEVLAAEFFKYQGYHFYLSHFPTLTANLDSDKPLKNRVISLCGHSHYPNKFEDMNKGLIYHCELDAHNCYPVNIDTIINEMKNKVKECKEVL